VSDEAQRAAASRMKKAALKRLEETRSLIEKEKTRAKLDAVVLADVVARFDAAKAHFEEGATALERGEAVVAFQKFKESLISVERLTVLLKTYRRLKSDGRERVQTLQVEGPREDASLNIDKDQTQGEREEKKDEAEQTESSGEGNNPVRTGLPN
jgi:hypothetical protein